MLHSGRRESIDDENDEDEEDDSDNDNDDEDDDDLTNETDEAAEADCFGWMVISAADARPTETILSRTEPAASRSS